uniref:Headcase domain-containing protein n=1 Tax=Haemonchus contortus TaxID=6289 RepID=A0A7I4YLM5_HAECO
MHTTCTNQQYFGMLHNSTAEQGGSSSQQTQQQREREREKKPKEDRRDDRVKGRKKENSDDYYYYYPDGPQGQGEPDPDDVVYDNRGAENQNQQQTQTQNQNWNQQQTQTQSQNGNQQQTPREEVQENDESQRVQQRPSQMREDNRDTCPSLQNAEVAFFVPYDAEILLSYGRLLPKNDSCICSTGMEYTFDGSSASNNPLQDSIGSYYCANNSNLCVQDVFGRQWRPARADNLITLVPVAKCIGGGQQCAVFLLMVASRPSLDADLVSGTERIRYRDMVANNTFIPFSSHVYLPIQGFSCNSCAEPYCRMQGLFGRP